MLSGGHSGTGEVSNLVRIHGSTLGQSAPSLSNTMVSYIFMWYVHSLSVMCLLYLSGVCLCNCRRSCVYLDEAAESVRGKASSQQHLQLCLDASHLCLVRTKDLCLVNTFKFDFVQETKILFLYL